VIERYKSGFSPPTDYPFEDLSTATDGQSANGSMSSLPPHISVQGSILQSSLSAENFSG
jgi:hypothetical protein